MIFNNFGFNAQRRARASGPFIITSGSVLNLDAANYPGSGADWPDTSPSNNTGTLQNSPSYTGGTAPYFSFVNTSNQFVSFATTNNIPTGRFDYTLIVWIQLASIRDNGFIGWGTYDSGNDKVNAFRSRGSNGLVNYWWGNDLEVNSTMTINTWYQCIALYAISDDTRRIYLNNSQIGSDRPARNQNVDINTNLTVAKTYGSEYLNGRLAVARIFNRALTAEERAADYTAFQQRFGL